MKNIGSQLENAPGIKHVKVNFRWPVHQTDDNTIVVQVPVAEGELISISPAVADALQLTERETDKLLTELDEIAIRKLAIID